MTEPLPTQPETVDPETADANLSVDLVVARGEPLVDISAIPRAPLFGRPRERGPFGALREPSGVERGELLDELLLLCQMRTRLVHGIARGKREGCWGKYAVGVLPSDLDAVRAALLALFAGDVEPARSFIARPGPLPPEARGPAWEPPTPGEGWLDR